MEVCGKHPTDFTGLWTTVYLLEYSLPSSLDKVFGSINFVPGQEVTAALLLLAYKHYPNSQRY